MKGVKVGDRVCGFVANGAYTQKLVCDEKVLVLIPEEMSFDEAAGFLMTYATAYFTLKERANVKKGETVLVHAAAGGVGSATVQIAKALGANVIGTVGSKDKVKIAKSLGCDEVVVYNNKTWPAQVLQLTKNKGVEIVCDSVGGDAFHGSLKCIAWGGRLCIVGFASGDIPKLSTNLVLLKNISLVGVFFGSYQKYDPSKIADCFAALFKLFAEKKVKPLIGGVFSFNQVVEALTCLENRTSVGKIIIHPQECRKSSL